MNRWTNASTKIVFFITWLSLWLDSLIIFSNSHAVSDSLSWNVNNPSSAFLFVALTSKMKKTRGGNPFLRDLRLSSPHLKLPYTSREKNRYWLQEKRFSLKIEKSFKDRSEIIRLHYQLLSENNRILSERIKHNSHTKTSIWRRQSKEIDRSPRLIVLNGILFMFFTRISFSLLEILYSEILKERLFRLTKQRTVFIVKSDQIQEAIFDGFMKIVFTAGPIFSCKVFLESRVDDENPCQESVSCDKSLHSRETSSRQLFHRSNCWLIVNAWHTTDDKTLSHEKEVSILSWIEQLLNQLLFRLHYLQLSSSSSSCLSQKLLLVYSTSQKTTVVIVIVCKLFVV